MKTINLDVSGMHCGGCASRVQTALSEVEGVDGVQVSLERGEASVSAGDDAASESLVKAVERAGYSASVRS